MSWRTALRSPENWIRTTLGSSKHITLDDGRHLLVAFIRPRSAELNTRVVVISLADGREHMVWSDVKGRTKATLDAVEVAMLVWSKQ